MTKEIGKTFIKKFAPAQTGAAFVPFAVTGDWCVVLWSNCFAWLQFDGGVKVVGRPGILYRRSFRQIAIQYPQIASPMQTINDTVSAPSIWVYGGDGECPDFLGDFDLWGDDLHTVTTGGLANNQAVLLASVDGQREVRISCPVSNTGPLMVGRGNYADGGDVGENIQPGTTVVVKTPGDVKLYNQSGAIQDFTVNVLAMQLPAS